MNPGDSVGVTMLSVTVTATAAATSSSTSNVDLSTSDCTRITSGSDATRVTCTSSGTVAETTTATTTTPEVVGARRQRVHPAAMALRLRVTQVVCGILTCVLGTVALIEERSGDLRLSSGLVAGIATVVASIASIYATFDSVGSTSGSYYDRVRWITSNSSGSNMDRTSCVLSTLWALAVVANLAMLAFAAIVFQADSSPRNLIVIGSLELAFGASVLVILAVNLCLALHYKEQLMRKN